MKKWIRNIVILFLAVLLVRCANIVTPSGGPKDNKQPVVTQTSPENNSTNFQGKTINITFDEFVTLNNPSNNVLISPPSDKKPTYRTHGKTLIIRFEEPLKPNTTYSINFGDAIKDLHEGNLFKGYTFNFSTGDAIDSLSLKGNVTSASAFTPMENMYVGLYSPDNDTLTLDSMPYLIKPNYITITDKKGNFEFSGLADKEYLIFALKDNNSNLIYDLPNEEIAFSKDLVRPYFIEKPVVIEKTKTDSIVNDSIVNDSIVNDSINYYDSIHYTDSIVKDTIIEDIIVDSISTIKKEYPVYELFSFIQEDSVQKLYKKELVEEGLLRFAFRYPAHNVSITTMEELPDTFSIMQVYSPRKDTVLWYYTPTKDSLWISINDGVNISDTTHHSLKPRESFSRKKRKQETQSIKRLTIKNNLKGNKLKPEQHLVLTFNEPVIKLNMRDTMIWVENNDTVFNNIRFEKLDEYGFKYMIANDLVQENSYRIIIPDSVFFGFRGVTNDTLDISFQVQEETMFGNIYLTVELPDDVPQAIIELTDEKGKTIEKQIITKTQELSFEYLNPNKYKLKATIDLDANGEWSPGNFNRRLQPEKIIFYKGVLEVRANWDIDLDEPWKLEK